ncbi:uncharacterized protein [Mytilus edulis]|uniref:uncharacterized protein n=1 Tax=Mytilus edulis TaxID=6550 RepID=UPI0039F07832
MDKRSPTDSCISNVDGSDDANGNLENGDNDSSDDAEKNDSLDEVSNSCMFQQEEQLRYGEFLKEELLNKLKSKDVRHSIPEGKKDNVCFTIDNSRNIARRVNNLRSEFSDDCGVWISSSGSTPKTYYGIFCTEKQINKKKECIPVDPQPADEKIVEISRSYSTLKQQSYKKRVTWVGKAPPSFDINFNAAVVEYKGKHPGFSAHGNSKKGNEFVRTPALLFEEMGELVKTMRPKNAYNKLLINCSDEATGPSAPRQIRDKKYRDKKKEIRNITGVTGNRGNMADNIQTIENIMQKGHSLIKHLAHSPGKTPCVILYTEEIMKDVVNLCCSGQTLLGFDKTFNICDIHVTPSVFKQLSVTKVETGEPPLFVGPMFLHDCSHFDTYSIFFSHLKTKLADEDTSELVIGSDQERSLVKAIVKSFPEATHVLCTRHLKLNLSEKMKNGVGMHRKDRLDIEQRIFGRNGISNADNSAVFEEKCEEVEEFCKEKLKPVLKGKIYEPQNAGRIEREWTNNNSESYNHVLKIAVDWKPQSLVDFVIKMTDMVEANYKDLRRAVIGRGPYTLASTHEHFKIDRHVWANKTLMERYKYFARFRRYRMKTKLVKSTDGRRVVNEARSKGKKKGQRKRKLADRTTTIKRQRVQ